MTKKWQGTALVMIGFLALGIFTYGVFIGFPGQAVLGDADTAKQVAVETAAGLKAGDASTVKFRVKDQTSDSKAQVAVELYVEETYNGDYSLREDNTTTSATADTSVSSKVGAMLKACAFKDGSYYGDCIEKEVKTESDGPHNIPVYQAATSLTVGCYKRGTDNCSLAIAGSNDDDYVDFIEIDQATANRAFNLKAIAWNTTADSNINDVKMSGVSKLDDLASSTFSESDMVLERRRKTIDWLFVLDEAVMLYENDVFKTPKVVIEATETNPSETVQFSILDESKYKSVSDNPNHILEGMEDDADTETDLGVADVYTNFVIK